MFRMFKTYNMRNIGYAYIGCAEQGACPIETDVLNIVCERESCTFFDDSGTIGLGKMEFISNFGQRYSLIIFMDITQNLHTVFITL